MFSIIIGQRGSKTEIPGFNLYKATSWIGRISINVVGRFPFGDEYSGAKSDGNPIIEFVPA